MKILSIVFFAVAFNLCLAQDKQVRIEKEKFGSINTLSLGDHGFILSTTQKETSVITYYSSSAEALWQAKAGKEYSTKMIRSVSSHPLMLTYNFTDNFMVATGTGSFVYNVEMKPNDYNGKPHYVTQVSKTGAVKKFTIEGRDELGKNLQTAFCDDRYFYYLATENGEEGYRKKKAGEVMILNRFDANDFSYKRIVIDLPPIEESDNSIYWTYLGQTASEKFLVSKNIDYENDKALFTIAAFNAEGKVVRTFTIDLRLEGKHIRPAYSVKSSFSNFYQCAELDYLSKTPQSASYSVIVPTNGGFSNISFDEATESFYVSGLFGPKPFRRIASEYDGFYVFKYNTQGALQWKLQQPASKELLDESYFRIHAMPGYREVCLKVLPNNVITFSIHFKKTLFSHAISPEGKVIETLKKDDFTMPIDNMVHVPARKLKSYDYLKKLDLKKKEDLYYSNFVTSQGEILFELDPKEAVTVLYFKP